MADRSTARAFGVAFEILAKYAEVAEQAGDQNILHVLRAVAEEIYDEQDGGYDYTPDQMEADEPLVTLGLATYRDEVISYRGED